MKIKMALTAGACLLGLAAAPASAATQIVSDGILTGATGVLVNGVSYDVVFNRGTCAEVFGSCQQSSFAFNTRDSAGLAAKALLDQVFKNTEKGIFDLAPKLTAFCDGEGNWACETFIPYAISEGFVGYSLAVNHVYEDLDSFGQQRLRSIGSSQSADFQNFAQFVVTPTAVGAVPEPTTWAMMIIGFGLIGSTMRRRKSAIATHVRFA